MNDTQPVREPGTVKASTAFAAAARDGEQLDTTALFQEAKGIDQTALAINTQIRSGQQTVRLSGGQLGRLATSSGLSQIVAAWVARCGEDAEAVARTGDNVDASGRQWVDLDGDGKGDYIMPTTDETRLR